MAAMINYAKYAYDYGCRIYFVQRDQKQIQNGGKPSVPYLLKEQQELKLVVIMNSNRINKINYIFMQFADIAWIRPFFIS
jgi:hypothetical protein